MSINGQTPVYNVIVINMGDTDGQSAAGRLFTQQVGFAKAAFRDASGAPVNNSRIQLSFGRQNDDRLTLDYNGKARCRVNLFDTSGKINNFQGVDAFRAYWTNTPGVFCYLTISQDSHLFEDDTPNPIQSFTQSVGTIITPATTNVTNAATLLVAASSLRQSVIIENNSASTVYIGNAAVTTATGLPLAANQSMTLDKSTAAVYAIAATAGPFDIRTLVETL